MHFKKGSIVSKREKSDLGSGRVQVDKKGLPRTGGGGGIGGGGCGNGACPQGDAHVCRAARGEAKGAPDQRPGLQARKQSLLWSLEKGVTGSPAYLLGGKNIEYSIIIFKGAVP